VTETSLAGYTGPVFGGDCDASGNVTVANGGSASCTVTNDDIAVTNVSQITPTATTCAMFRDGTSATLDTLNYSVKNGKINQVNPGVFFYWVKVSGGGTYTIDQSITTGNFSTQFAMAAGSAVFDASCVKVGSATLTQSGGDVTVTFSGSGDFYIGIKYDTGTVKNQTAPIPTTVHYEFTTSGVSGSTSGLDLKLKP
jgi:hypothetical protein